MRPLVANAQLLRFALVGLLQNGVNLAVFAATLALGVAYELCAAIAAVTALAVSFVLNRGFTFMQRDRAMHTQLWRYTVVFVASILAGLGLLILAVEAFGVGKVTGQLIAIVIVAPLSYLAQKHWTFRVR